MCRAGPGVVKIFAVVCMIEAVCYVGFNLFCILMWACVPDIDSLDADSYFTKLYFLRYLDAHHCNIAVQSQEIIDQVQDSVFKRSSQLLFIFNAIYLTLHVIWILSCCLVISAINSRKPKRRIVFVLLTACLSAMDVALAVVFGLDLDTNDYKNVGVLPVIMFARGFVFWIFNVVALFLVLRSVRPSKKPTLKEQPSTKASPVPKPLHPAPPSEHHSDSDDHSSTSEEPYQEQQDKRAAPPILPKPNVSSPPQSPEPEIREEAYREQQDKRAPPPIILPKPNVSSQPQSPEPVNSASNPEPKNGPNLYPVIPVEFDNGAYVNSSSDESDISDRRKPPPPTMLRNQRPWSYLDTQAKKRIASQSSQESVVRNASPVKIPPPDYDQPHAGNHGTRAIPTFSYSRPMDPPVDYYQTGSRPAIGFKYEDRSRF